MDLQWGDWISLKWTNGIDGEDGQEGSNGKNGKDGVSCNIIYQDSDSLKISCGTDTTSFFIGGTETKSSNGTQKILIDERDDKQYRTVSIGKQTWMAENLNYDYNEGTAQSICYEEEGGCEQYGHYYTWAAAVDSAAIFSKNVAACGYDSRFMTIEDAERFVVEFVDWYNNEHLHSGLDLLPPCAVHFGYHQEILDRRNALLERSRELHPERVVSRVFRKNSLFQHQILG